LARFGGPFLLGLREFGRLSSGDEGRPESHGVVGSRWLHRWFCCDRDPVSDCLLHATFAQPDGNGGANIQPDPNVDGTADC